MTHCSNWRYIIRHILVITVHVKNQQWPKLLFIYYYNPIWLWRKTIMPNIGFHNLTVYLWSPTGTLWATPGPSSLHPTLKPSDITHTKEFKDYWVLLHNYFINVETTLWLNSAAFGTTLDYSPHAHLHSMYTLVTGLYTVFSKYPFNNTVCPLYPTHKQLHSALPNKNYFRTRWGLN